MTTPVHQKYPTACYIVICRDAPDGAEKRKGATAAHLRHIEECIGEFNVAGPMFDEAGTRPIGSVLLLRTQNAQEARALTERDPYFKAGVWDSIEVLPFFPAAGSYVGGTTW
jgi:uncharacterized protein YciI